MAQNFYMHLLKQYFLLLIILEDVAILNWKQFFYLTVSQCKWVSGVDTDEAEIAADSIIWELFAKNQLNA
jgi:hypothetical protein